MYICVYVSWLSSAPFCTLPLTQLSEVWPNKVRWGVDPSCLQFSIFCVCLPVCKPVFSFAGCFSLPIPKRGSLLSPYWLWRVRQYLKVNLKVTAIWVCPLHIDCSMKSPGDSIRIMAAHLLSSSQGTLQARGDKAIFNLSRMREWRRDNKGQRFCWSNLPHSRTEERTNY